jgi:hypothetical protein
MSSPRDGDRLGDAEVGDVRVASGGKEHVRRLDVATAGARTLTATRCPERASVAANTHAMPPAPSSPSTT